jgi:hypothetical protein
MFILYPIILAVVVAVLTGGSLAGLSDLRLRHARLVAAAFLVQVVLFAGPVSAQIGALGPPLYVASTAVVLAVVIYNARIPGLAIVAIGAGCNLAAITANGGYMPADPAALEALGHGVNAGYSNSSVVAEPALRFLTDIYVLPRFVPFANVFSVGDVVIGLGLVIVVLVATRPRRAPDPGVPARPAEPAPDGEAAGAGASAH